MNISTGLTQSLKTVEVKGVRKGGLGLKKTLELDILQNFITCAKEINCFRILFCLLICRLNANTTE